MTSSRHPTTLRAIAGLPDSAPAIGDAALLVIDAQQAYSPTGVLTLDGVESAQAQVVDLVGRARRVGAPVIHVSHVGGPGSPFDPLDGGRFLGGLEPADGESLVRKTLPNSFVRTNLAELLEHVRRRPLIIVGFMTHMCVSATARAALDLGLETTVVSDATATRDLPGVDGASIVPASVVHQAALAALADRCSVVVSSDQLID